MYGRELLEMKKYNSADIKKTSRIDRLISELYANMPVIEIFSDVEPDPDLTTVRKGAALMNSFQPDVVIALGGGSAMDAAKIMWVLYEHPEADFMDMAMRFIDIRKRVYTFPKSLLTRSFLPYLLCIRQRTSVKPSTKPSILWPMAAMVILPPYILTK